MHRITGAQIELTKQGKYRAVILWSDGVRFTSNYFDSYEEAQSWKQETLVVQPRPSRPFNRLQGLVTAAGYLATIAAISLAVLAIPPADAAFDPGPTGGPTQTVGTGTR